MENGECRVGHGRRHWHAGIVLTLLLGLCGGCQVEEALIDGLYGGISDTVATVVAEVLLNALP